MDGTQDFVSVYQHYLDLSLDEILAMNDGTVAPTATKDRILALVQSAVTSVPAYQSFLQNTAYSSPNTSLDLDARFLEFLEQFPFITKPNFISKYPIASRCRDGKLSGFEIMHVSSGSGGEPTFWGRTALDELAIATRFEQILRDFGSQHKPTLAVVAFPMGSWVGGVFTTFCLRYVSQKGYPLTLITPGNNIDDILRVTTSLAPSFEQTVILGYPPFVKAVIVVVHRFINLWTTTVLNTALPNNRRLSPRINPLLL
jgi:phenylacetate-CoA ligase